MYKLPYFYIIVIKLNIVSFNYMIEKVTTINGLIFKRKCDNDDQKKKLAQGKNYKSKFHDNQMLKYKIKKKIKK